jgi:hypothetical protein
MTSWGNVQSTVKVKFPVWVVATALIKQRKLTLRPVHDPVARTVVTGGGTGVGVGDGKGVGPVPQPVSTHALVRGSATNRDRRMRLFILPPRAIPSPLPAPGCEASALSSVRLGNCLARGIPASAQ